jgi:hypothetical protein
MNVLESIVRLALSSLIKSGAANLAVPVRRAGIQTGAAIVVAIFAIGAMGCVTTALWLLVTPILGSVGAALVAATWLLLIGVVVLVSTALMLRNQNSNPAARHSGQLPIAQANQLLKDNKGSAILLAVLAGMLTANNQRKD